MIISEFVQNFKDKKITNTKIAPDAVQQFIAKELEIKEYISFADKRELCKAVIDACCTKEGGLIKVDSVSRYIIFTISVISAYTTLEFSSGEEYDSLDEYDMLCEADLLNPILALIGEEYVACNNMLNMMMEDVIANNNTVEAILGYSLDKASDSLDKLISALAKKVEEMEFDLNQIDIEPLKGLMNLLPKK